MDAPFQRKALSPLEMIELEREVTRGLQQTVMIFRKIGLPDTNIAALFRAAADGLDPPITVEQTVQ